MSSGVAERMRPERRRALVRVAAREFAQAGFAQASLNRVIRECGLSKSSFYHFVPSKQELFALVVRELGGELLARLAVPEPHELEGEAFWPGIGAIAARLARASGEDESYLAFGRMFYLARAPTDASDAVARALSAVDDWLGRVVEVGRTSGQVRTDLPASLQTRMLVAVLRALDEWTVGHASEIDEPELDAILDAQLAALRRLLAPEPATPPASPA